MPIPLFQSAGQLSRKGWVVTTLVVYGAMCVGLLGYFTVFPDERTEKARAGVSLASEQSPRAQSRSNVVGSRDRYPAKSLSAEAR